MNIKEFKVLLKLPDGKYAVYDPGCTIDDAPIFDLSVKYDSRTYFRYNDSYYYVLDKDDIKEF